MRTAFVIKILSKYFSAFSGNKQIKPGRFSRRIITFTSPVAHCFVGKFMKILLGECEVEALLVRSNYLTKDETQMTVASP